MLALHLQSRTLNEKGIASAAVFFIQIAIVIIVAIDELRTNVINIVRRMTRTTTYSSERSSFDVVASLSEAIVSAESWCASML